MPPKRSVRSAKAPSKPRAVGPKARAAKAKHDSSALMEATETAEEAVRTRGSTPKGERRSRSRSKAPEAAPGKEESPQPQSGGASRASTGRPPSRTARWLCILGAGDIWPIEEKQVEDNTTMADTEAVAGMSASDTAGSKPKADPPVKRLTLAQGLERAQASKAAAAAKAASEAKAGEASAKKQVAPSSSPGGSSSKLFSDSESENEEGTIREDREVSNDLDEQQQYQAAASGSHARQSAAATAVGSSSGGGASYPQGYFPPEPGTGAPALLEKLTAPRGLISGYTSRGSYERALVEKEPLFLGDIDVARCVLLAPHKLTLKEFTTLRKKPEDKGGLHPVWGFHWVKPNENMTWSEVEDLFWRYVQRKGYSEQEYKELREDRTLSAILDMRELHIEFAQLVSKRKLRPKMDELKQGARAKAREERGRGATTSATVPRTPAKKPRTTYEAAAASRPISQQPSGSLPGAAQRAPTSYPTQGNPSTSRAAGAYHGVAAPKGLVPRDSGSAHDDQGGPAVASHDHGYEPEATQPHGGGPSQVVALQQEEIRLLRDRVYVLEIALGVALGGEAASRAGQPGAVEQLRAYVASLFRETRDLHGRVDRRADLSSYDSLRNQLAGLRTELHGHAPQQQPHSYQVQFDQGSYGAPAYAAPMYAAPSYDQRAYQAPYRDPTPRFEELRSSPLGHPPLPAAQPEPEGHEPLKTTHVKRRVSCHRLG
ncbi:hypothetical protein PR003_g25433 [Phytophthora rubi]|uniref:Uncharacterized protein n=1 Tax=Phytophthora rubi TaxID=129364 RepID=A0A6A4CI16_9STRA|nr:hypothetical protein PR003_g25433 [Phytophthora rubi]